MCVSVRACVCVFVCVCMELTSCSRNNCAPWPSMISGCCDSLYAARSRTRDTPSSEFELRFASNDPRIITDCVKRALVDVVDVGVVRLSVCVGGRT